MSKNDESVFQRLLNHCARLSDDIVVDYNDSLHSGTPEAVASYRETFIQEIVGRFFPRTYRVAKGAIYDSFGGRSNSIDCVVCAPNHPLLLDTLGRITTLLVEGVHCAIEIKPDVTDRPEDFGRSRRTRPELIRGLDQVRTVKRLMRRETGLLSLGGIPVQGSAELHDYARRIPTYLFSVKSTNIDRSCEYVNDYYFENRVPVAMAFKVIRPGSHIRPR